MLYNFLNIDKKESNLFTLLKIVLLLQVMIGHSIGLIVPKFDSIDITSFYGIILFIYKFSFSFGREAAYIFVFLSGFFTAKLFINDKNIIFFDSLKKRIYRIYPIFLFSLFLTIILDSIGIYIFNFNIYTSNGMNYIVNEHYSLKITILNFLSLQPTLTNTIGSNGPLWTLGYLVQFYILGLIVKKFSTSNYIFYIMNILISGLIGLIFSFEFFLLYLVWISGISFRFLNFKIDFKYLKLLCTVLLIITLLLCRINSSYISILLTPISSILILFMIKKFPEKIISFNFATMSAIKDISYSMYAFHMPIFFLSFGLYQYLFDHSFDYFYYLIFLSISLLIIILLSNSLENLLNKRGNSNG